MPEQKLKDKVAVIGAGAKNLGSLISQNLGAEGASVAVHYNSDSTRESAEKTVAAIAKSGSRAFAIQGDLTKVSEVTRLFDETASAVWSA
jgi:NAD(P)-dependent dehydrogenase (short-subunit alcohol dehydrogenase family)